jgi:hypothetical protein
MEETYQSRSPRAGIVDLLLSCFPDETEMQSLQCADPEHGGIPDY